MRPAPQALKTVRELFIYYRVVASREPEALACVLAFQAALRERHSTIQARLLRRPETQGGGQTWMETYAEPSVVGGITETLQAEIEALALPLAPLIAGPRHVEVFIAA